MQAQDLITNTLTQAIQYQTQGDFANAKALFKNVIEVEPRNFVALHSLAVIAHNLEQFDEAIQFCTSALGVNPTFATTYFVRARCNFRQQNIKAAQRDIELALKIDPKLDGASDLKALINSQIRSIDNPAHQEASALLHQAIALQSSGKMLEAKQVFKKVIELDQTNFAAIYSLGVLESQTDNSESALSYFTLASQVDPENALGHFALGTHLQSLGLHEAALESLDRSIQLDPTHIPSYNNKTTLLHNMNRHLDAIKTADAALKFNPDDLDSLCHIGYLHTEFKQFTTAATYFRRLLDLSPTYPYANGLHMFARLHSCDWSTYEQNTADIIKGLKEGRKVCNPFAIMSISDDAALAQKCAEIFGAHKFAPSKEQLWNGEVYRHRKKRIAFISSDFREHPVGYLLIGLIEAMKRDRVELTCLSLGIRDGSELYNRYRLAFDNYLDCADKTSSEIANLIRSYEIDVAIDLSGYTAGSRLDILAKRPAPVQATYLGYPGTLGLPYIDYIIADRNTIPEHLSKHYSEKIAYLPKCYLPRDSNVVPSPETKRKSDYGLPEYGRVLCSFNHDYKISPPIFSAWMEILKEFPDCTLWLMKLNEDAQGNLTKEALKQGVDPSRIVYATRVPSVEEHLARYRLADLGLDTYPYNGHTTTSDALLSGLPVITISGEIFASRVAGSLLNDYNLNELVAENIQEYKELIREYIKPAQNKIIKDKLQKEINKEKIGYGNIDRSIDFENTLMGLVKLEQNE